MRIINTVIFCILTICQLYAQGPAQIREYLKEYKTYPFSDPDPLPNPGNIYPYYRFDGFTNESVLKKWKVVELENDFIKVSIMPEIGGKIWSTIDKRTGKSFIYENHVVKFRDISMRGPWTSGGIEPNYGLIGHTPNCATPVDYKTSSNADGSVSCFISVLDRLSMTRWNLEVNLPKDKAYFVTRSFWHNNTSSMQPYYTWMNAAVKTKEDLQFLYPGTTYIGHNGEAYPWPMDKERGKNLSNYAENNFDGAKSYHVVGTHSKYFGTYWKNEDYGMVHYANREEKLGKKLFLWALSENGKIWEELLTDNDGQYAEVQSGRLFNQNFYKSSFTPFKQLAFFPYQSDTWSEYWYPFNNTKGITDASLNGVVNFKQTSDSLYLYISPIATIQDSLKIYAKSGKLLYAEPIQLKPLVPYTQSIALKSGQAAKLILNKEEVDLQPDLEKNLDRPVIHKADFDWESDYGLYFQGRDLIRYRNYADAEVKIRQSLVKNSSFMPALTEMAAIQYHKMKYDSAYHYAKTALSIDAYDPSANYHYGLAAAGMEKWFDAMDGFEVASLNSGFNSAANTELSKIYLKRKDYAKAYEYASKSLQNNTQNLSGLQLQYVAARLLNKETSTIKDKILKLEPLNHFVRFETYLNQPDETNKQAFVKYITSEMPEETFLDLSAWYFRAGRLKESKKVLDLSPSNSEILFWRAYLSEDEKERRNLLNLANKSSAYLVFPYLAESAGVMEWAMKQNKDWKPVYYLALINNFRNNKDKASGLLDGVKSSVNFAPFYSFRATFAKSADERLEDLVAATKAEPRQWRYGNFLAEHHLAAKRYKKALEVITPYYKAHSENYITGLVYIRSLLLNDKYAEAEKELSKINILPYEDATYGRNLYKEIKLMLAYKALLNKNYTLALQKVAESELYPRNIGVGRPYENQIDSSMELWLKSAAYKASGDQQKALESLKLIASAEYDSTSVSSLIKSYALKQSGNISAGDVLFQKWVQSQTDAKLIDQGKAFYSQQNGGFEFILKTISQKEDKRLF